MPAAPHLMDEPFRVEAARRLGILDTAPEPAFDRIALIVQAVTGAPTALVSFFDADRLWAKAKVGFDGRETPRDLAFCSHAVLSPDVTWVEDARLDPRFADNPLVQGEPHVRFYAGAPVKLTGDVRVGTVCAFGPEPRPHDPVADAALSALADIVAEQVEARARAARG